MTEKKQQRPATYYHPYSDEPLPEQTQAFLDRVFTEATRRFEESGKRKDANEQYYGMQLGPAINLLYSALTEKSADRDALNNTIQNLRVWGDTDHYNIIMRLAPAALSSRDTLMQAAPLIEGLYALQNYKADPSPK